MSASLARRRSPGAWLSVAGLCSLLLPACGPGQSGPLNLDLRFATLEQAQTGSGLPPEVVALQVEVYQGPPGGSLLADSGCVDLASGSEQRQAFSLDLEPTTAASVVVQGWTAAGCAGDAQWRGMAFGVQVVAGQETDVAVYVTRQGNRLNPIRDQLTSPRAFASATLLADGRVLIAGGFDRASAQGARVELSAACDAMLYDPGSATIERVVPMANCRALHQALLLGDGRVMLLGGCSRAVFDPAGSTRPLLRPDADALLTGAEVFDPASETFAPLSTDALLQRALAPAVLLPGAGAGAPLLVGGRSPTEVRSAGLIRGSPAAGDDWSWQGPSPGLVAARAGARAVTVARGSSYGALVAGGNLPGQPDLEWIDQQPAAGQVVALLADPAPSLALAGHSLTTTGEESAVRLAGGLENAPGSRPSDLLLDGVLEEAGLQAELHRLSRPRAYHTALALPTGDGVLSVFIGGLDEDLVSVADVETALPRSDGQELADELLTGSLGTAAALLLDGSALIVGGLDVDAGGQVSLSAAGQILTP